MTSQPSAPITRGALRPSLAAPAPTAQNPTTTPATAPPTWPKCNNTVSARWPEVLHPLLQSLTVPFPCKTCASGPRHPVCSTRAFLGGRSWQPLHAPPLSLLWPCRFCDGTGWRNISCRRRWKFPPSTPGPRLPTGTLDVHFGWVWHSPCPSAAWASAISTECSCPLSITKTTCSAFRRQYRGRRKDRGRNHRLPMYVD